MFRGKFSFVMSAKGFNESDRPVCLLLIEFICIIFNVFDDESTCWNYQEGILSMKVTRKGSVISTLDADWLELTTFYYKQGLSLIDSFVCWETSKGKFYIMIC